MTPPADTTHADLREEAARWSTEHAEFKPPADPQPAPGAPGASSDKTPASSSSSSDKDSSSSSSSTSSEPNVINAAAWKARREMAQKLAALGWGILDIFVPKRLGKRMKLEPDEKAQLIELSVPIIEKRLPLDDEGEGLSDEELLVMAAAAIYGPKYVSPEPDQKSEAPPPGGTPPKAEGSGTSQKPGDQVVDGEVIKRAAAA